jgi:hypothetical protein
LTPKAISLGIRGEIMSKQDRQGARTPADVERRVGGSLSNVARGVSDVQKRVSDVQKRASNVEKEVVDLKNKKITVDQLDIDGQELNIKVDHTNIKGHLTADQIDTTNLKVKVANVEGLLNVNGKIEAKQIDADGIVAKNVDISGIINASVGRIGDWVLDTAFIPYKKPDGSEGTHDPQSALYSGEQRYETVSGSARIETWLTAKGVYLKVKIYERGTFDGVYYDEFYKDTQYPFKSWWQILTGGN